jgi:hypothetical protein
MMVRQAEDSDDRVEKPDGMLMDWFFIGLPVYSSPDTCQKQDLAPFLRILDPCSDGDRIWVGRGDGC